MQGAFQISLIHKDDAITRTIPHIDGASLLRWSLNAPRALLRLSHFQKPLHSF